MAEKIAATIGAITFALVLTAVKVSFWVYLFYVAHHFVVKYW